MTSRKKLRFLTGISCIFWLAAMGMLYNTHYIKESEPELGYFGTEIGFDTEDRQYFSIFKDGVKIGYKSEAQSHQENLLIYSEYSGVKMNLAGKSREVFMQYSVGIDSAQNISRFMEFNLISGSHSYVCDGTVIDDSLIVNVKSHSLAPYRRGFFLVDEHITYPVTLPYFIHRSETSSMRMMVFDPFIMIPYIIHVVRTGGETLHLNNQDYDVVRYDMVFLDKKSSLWLDENGKVIKSEGSLFLSGELGEFKVEKAVNRDVFLMPVEVSFGNDIIKNTVINSDRSLSDPRNISYLEIELDGIRTANIDISSSNKEILSYNPVVFGIHNKPVVNEESSNEELKNRYFYELKITEIDTSLIGSSDYIQPRDARIVRMAQQIVSSETDSLAKARALNRWIYKNVKKESGLDITRSVDILKELRGDCDEHTKLFTAFARSIGIPTQINLGLIYDNNAFRYHSWPSVFVGGVWNDMDPMLGQDSADAAHVTLIRGGFERLAELLRVMGRISIKIIDYR